MSHGLHGKVAVVTGASAGIGAACARALAEAGADVVIAARREEVLAEVASSITALGRRAVPVAADLTDVAVLAGVIETACAELGGVDILVNNAGGWPPRPFLQTSPRFLERAFHWNVTVAFELSRTAVPHMLERGGGAIVNISSAMARFSDRAFLAYGTTKAALSHMTRLMAAELAPRIRVNGVAPGAIETESLGTVINDEIRAAMIAATPLRRLGSPEDIGAAVAFLASPAASFITGKILEVDGGTESPPLSMPIADL